MKRAGRLGRRIAIGIYLTATAYMVVVGFNSVIRQVFFPPLPAAAQALGPLGPEACASELDALRQTLLTSASEHVAEGGAEPIDPWLAAWDHRYRMVSSRCPDSSRTSDAAALLQRLRYRIETTLRRFDREEARLSVRVHELVTAEAAEPRGIQR